MTTFIILSALLLLLVMSLFVLPLFKTQRPLAMAIIFFLPLLSFALYYYLGSPQAINAPVAIAENEPAPSIETAIANLEAELNANPNNVEGWVLLARTQMQLENYSAANQAFEKARELDANNPDLKADHAEAMMRASGKRAFPESAVVLLQEAITTNPQHQRALFFLGMHYLQAGETARAETYLNTLMPQLDAQAAEALREQINLARAEQNLAPLEIKTPENAASTAGIQVNITIDKNMAEKIKPGAVLFVFAKSVNGGGPPVAAKRIEVTKFPVSLNLSDADSLMPTANLSSQEKVSISARISLQGIANAQAGDIEAEAVIIDTKNKKPVDIILSRVKQ